MPLGRFLVSSRPSAGSELKDAFTNTLYFNITEDPVEGTNWQALVDDLYAAWAIRGWAVGRFLDIRAYDMGDPTPRPIKAEKQGQVTGTAVAGVPQVALALSYYADRNLPRSRGRIFLGPWSTGTVQATTAQQNQALGLAQALADLGGINVDWSIYSPTNGTNTRINHAWVDNSWDVIRSRKLVGTNRVTWNGDG